MTETDQQVKFIGLVEAYGADLYRYALWMSGNEAVAKDLVQETYVRAWKALHSLKDVRAAKSWLITIVRREHARMFERKVPPMANIDDIELPEDRELGPDDRLEIEQLRAGILKLAPRYREPLILQVVMGFSCEEIAQELNISRSAAATQLFRAREQLKQRLQQDREAGNVHAIS